MLKEVKAIFARSSSTLIEDAIGTVAIFTLLFAGLHLLPHRLCASLTAPV